MASRAPLGPAVGGRTGTASGYDNDSKEDDSGTTGDSTAWRDHTDAISIVRDPNP